MEHPRLLIKQSGRGQKHKFGELEGCLVGGGGVGKKWFNFTAELEEESLLDLILSVAVSN
jgi:hypothetical protein